MTHSEGPAAQTARQGWRAVIILAIAYIFSYMDRQILSLLIEPIRHDLQISDTQISLLTGLAFAICYSTTALPMGRLADLGNRRNLIAAGVLVWSAMTAACGLAQNFAQMFVARMGVGVGEAALPPAAYSMIADYFPPQRLALAMSIFVIGAPLGGGLALIAGGSLVGIVATLPEIMLAGVAVRPWQLVFLTIGGAGLAVSALVLAIREPTRGRQTLDIGGDHPSVADVARHMSARAPLFAPLLIGLSLGNVFNYGYMAWLPTLFIRAHGWTLTQAGLGVGTLIMACGCLGAVCGGLLVGRLYRNGHPDACLRSTILGAMVLLPTSALAPLVGPPGLALALAGPVLFAIFMNAAVFPTLIQMVTPAPIRGQVSAACLLVTNLAGLGLGPTAYALTGDYVFGQPEGLRLALSVVSAALLAVTLVCYWRARPHYRTEAAAIAQEAEGRLSV